MKNKSATINQICETGIVSVVRAENSEKGFRIVDACLEGGINAIEITFTIPNAQTVINDLADKYLSNDIILGAGTVMDTETARIAILSGAQYIVTPYFNEEIIKMCNRYGVPCIPGVVTLKEMVEAMELGVDILKLFPGEMFGPSIIKTFKGPLPHVQLMPTGGVSLGNVEEWIKSGAVAVGVGNSLTSGANQGDYASITETGKQFIQKITEARYRYKIGSSS
ncbi:bifunctional 4-hydroxy-2-oxoglutarate aldolase/2-dehydro-3-deoxy-phosphogluconate aldolase [Peribacillus cavernae]|uniref:Bifunctional 4-hydroxy-2-oxoglutarate aldolase/2-dehydro-3-deoxy-phosphogluconate aldolase n=1 Tax=Peribacillus cavernae TaxID=1674310 RepID=A0A433HW32_9BACI|nr:bifunctional 2-keto-4-hydroxyglutarate aldolase/2-keto-3-deoxy-6-phosphogluconate aldolase [Peribacillus cavernae]MDQ0220720.1 2-dehydro-3-deoxyphosphogluconate aldolase/(4S)-4-hydroxy-2-oxoglutarate aldolase [Peribacillus cavernae]RUQ32434.1 bifunctional 4-hydroxy-2-oxoglutarate aldolase/2-dehydro-3-deoxy-phosphogluconate aldolase [Peribacillus cavernae]